MRGYLLAEVDGTDINTIGVYADPHLARDAYLEQERERGHGDAFEEWAVVTVDNFAEAYAQERDRLKTWPEGVPTNFSMRFESGFISMDILIEAVEVNL